MAEITADQVADAWNGSSTYRAIELTLMALYQQQVKTNALLAVIANNTKAGSGVTINLPF